MAASNNILFCDTIRQVKQSSNNKLGKLSEYQATQKDHVHQERL